VLYQGDVAGVDESRGGKGTRRRNFEVILPNFFSLWPEYGHSEVESKHEHGIPRQVVEAEPETKLKRSIAPTTYSPEVFPLGVVVPDLEQATTTVLEDGGLVSQQRGRLKSFEKVLLRPVESPNTQDRTRIHAPSGIVARLRGGVDDNGNSCTVP